MTPEEENGEFGVVVGVKLVNRAVSRGTRLGSCTPLPIREFTLSSQSTAPPPDASTRFSS